MQMVFSKIHPAFHSIVNSIKPGSNSKKTDKHATDCSKAVCWGVKWSIWDVKVVHTTMWPKASVSLTKKQFMFIQENFHDSKSFWKIYPHKEETIAINRDWVSFCWSGHCTSQRPIRDQSTISRWLVIDQLPIMSEPKCWWKNQRVTDQQLIINFKRSF